MKMNDDQMKKFKDFLDEKWKNPQKCPICAADDWGISDKIFEMREFNTGVTWGSAMLMPLINILCKSCGYTLLFNALIPGIVKPSGKGENNA